MTQILEGIAVLGAFTLYMIPSIEADAHNRDDAFAITMVNVLLGWTVIGWVAAFMWARRPATEKRLTHLVRRTHRAVARVTIDKLVAHAQSRSALQSQMVGKLRVRTRAVAVRQS
ncbi:superinfection immunity protein [Paraburkholderia sp.]|jgi:heme/copper-type cytochrome/quinol oxidase subunit 2|uniref:superinfection immunity protein n=1 Tax=Paraburkholderia sp. TaxID=1926495 RepID=UPI000EFB5BA5|nr:superinfection immunity protein [Paraburkholderia sp.]